MGTAAIRAAHQLLDDKPLLLDDPAALPLLGPGAAELIHASLRRHQGLSGKALRSHIVLRSRFAEDKLREAVVGGVTHYILVGAGFETFALRQPDWAKKLTIIEVDHPATQSAKRERIAKAGLSEPENLMFVPIDFEREGLGDVLARSGVRGDERVFFSWLGVTMYLRIPAIEATLHTMATYAPGSEVTLTFRQPLNGAGLKLAALVAELGEPYVTFFTPEKIEAEMRSAGFSDVEFLTVEKARQLYFTPLRRDLPLPERINILHASSR
jgi:methyltransferase (TIGR00027 family)